MSLAYHSSSEFHFARAARLHRIVLSALAVFCAALLLSSAAGAQDIFGRIGGTITDSTGAAIPNAKVTITNEETKLTRTVNTDDKGFYLAPELAAGLYRVTAEEKGFKTVTKAGNDLVAGARL